MNGTKQYNDVKTMYDQIEMMIRTATNCKKLEDAVATLTLGSMAIGLGGSKYALEERHVDQNDLHLAISTKWRKDDHFTLTGGLVTRWNRTENYKKINDLLGGQYYLNVDQFAERDFASNEAATQNDLDYFLAHGEAEKITKGGKYGYDYYANIHEETIWANGAFTYGR